jgi:hypothetical protein
VSDMISNDAAQTRWRQLFEAAVFELDPEQLPGRITKASIAVLDRIEGGFPNLSQVERLALHDALDMLLGLHDIAQREIDEQKKTGT